MLSEPPDLHAHRAGTAREDVPGHDLARGVEDEVLVDEADMREVSALTRTSHRALLCEVGVVALT